MIADGTVVDGKYHILRPLGGGAMGKVYLAEKVTTHERFAIKFIHDYLVSDETYYARFEREINALRGIRHPHVVATYDWKLPEQGKAGNAYIVMEYLTGESMQQALARPQGMPLEQLVRIMLHVLDGLAAVHALGVIHRDLSPANIFLMTGDPLHPSAKIVDFGLAKGEAASSSSDSSGGVTQDGAVLGRAAYAAPEMFLGRELDPRADLFACGMIMYRALAGRFPYRESKTELMWVERYSQRHEEGRPYPAARSLKSSIPGPVDQIISLAIRKRPQERYQSAEQMQRDLLKVEEILRLTPKVTPAIKPEPPPLLPDMAPMQTATRVEVPAAMMASAAAAVGGSADSGSPTPSPATGPAGMQSVQNWLVADGSRPSTRPGRIRRWSLVHPRAKFAVAGTLLAIGLLSVFIALASRGGGSSSTQAAAGAPADAGTAEPSVKVAQAGSADAGRRAAADANAGRAEVAASPEAPAARPPEAGVAAAADAAPPAGPKVTISLDGMPDGAEVRVDGVKVVDGMAVVAQSEEKPVTITARAPGYLDYETEYLPVADTIFFVEMEPEEAAAADGGREGRDAGDAGADARREATTTVRRDGGTTVRRDGGTTTVRRDAGTTRRDGGLGIIGRYE